MTTDCDECEYMIEHEQPSKWPDCGCGKCGRSKEELIKASLNIECRTCCKLDLICVGKPVEHVEKLVCYDSGLEDL